MLAQGGEAVNLAPLTISETRQDFDRHAFELVPGTVRVQEARQSLDFRFAAVGGAVVRVGRRDRVVHVVGRASVRATGGVREFAEGEVDLVLRAGSDVVRIFHFVDCVQEREGLDRRDGRFAPHRHAFGQLADLGLDLLPRPHGVLVLGLDRTHVTQAEAARLLHDADSTVLAREAVAVERSEERSRPLEVVELEEVIPLLTHDRALVFEHAAVDLEGQHFVRATRQLVAVRRRDPALHDQRSDRQDHALRIHGFVLAGNGLRGDHRLVRATHEVELPFHFGVLRLALFVERPLDRGFPLDRVVHPVVFQELLGRRHRRGHLSFLRCWFRDTFIIRRSWRLANETTFFFFRLSG